METAAREVVAEDIFVDALCLEVGEMNKKNEYVLFWVTGWIGYGWIGFPKRSRVLYRASGWRKGGKALGADWQRGRWLCEKHSDFLISSRIPLFAEQPAPFHFTPSPFVVGGVRQTDQHGAGFFPQSRENNNQSNCKNFLIKNQKLFRETIMRNSKICIDKCYNCIMHH